MPPCILPAPPFPLIFCLGHWRHSLDVSVHDALAVAVLQRPQQLEHVVADVVVAAGGGKGGEEGGREGGGPGRRHNKSDKQHAPHAHVTASYGGGKAVASAPAAAADTALAAPFAADVVAAVLLLSELLRLVVRCCCCSSWCWRWGGVTTAAATHLRVGYSTLKSCTHTHRDTARQQAKRQAAGDEQEGVRHNEGDGGW